MTAACFGCGAVLPDPLPWRGFLYCNQACLDAHSRRIIDERRAVLAMPKAAKSAKHAIAGAARHTARAPRPATQPKRFCPWCGDDRPANARKPFCNSECEREYAADIARSA